MPFDGAGKDDRGPVRRNRLLEAGADDELETMNRAVGVLAAAFWLIAMTLLVRRDVLPFWTAQEAPAQALPNETFQIGICQATGNRLGTTWVRMAPTATITTVRSTTLLDLRAVSGLLPIQGPVIFDTHLTYQPGGLLDQFQFRVDGAPFVVHVVGERSRNDFACTVTVGEMKKTIPLDARLSEYLAESMRPFTHLKDLHVGQSWRIRLLDPFALLQGGNLNLKMQLVTVTGRESIDHDGRQIACFRIETEGATAWADDAGRILRQDVQIPLLGKWTLTDEPFDPKARSAAIARVKGDPEKPAGDARHDREPEH